MTPFSPLELVVIHIGKRDRLACPTGDGRFARLLKTIFGSTPPPPLSDLRLEALRMLVIALRRNRRNMHKALAVALGAGITGAQIDYLVNGAPASFPGRRDRVAVWSLETGERLIHLSARR